MEKRKRDLDRLGKIVSNLINRVQAYAAMELEKYKLTYKEYQALILFKDNNEYSMGEISRALFVSRANTTVIVNNLITKGIAKRVYSKEDRRVIKIRLKGEGEKTLKKIDYARQMDTGLMLEAIPTQEIIVIVKGLEFMVKSLDKMLSINGKNKKNIRKYRKRENYEQDQSSYYRSR